MPASMPNLRGVQLFTLSAYLIANSSVYPTITRVDVLNLPQASWLVGLHLASTIENASTNPTGFFVVIGQKAPVLSITKSMQMLCAHASGVTGSPVSRSTWISEGLYGIQVSSASPVSLYFCGEASAIYPATCVASLQLVPAQ